MKRSSLKRGVAIALSLMMIVVFTPTIAFADAGDTEQVTLPVTEADLTEKVVGTSNQNFFEDYAKDSEPALQEHSSGSLTANTISTPSELPGNACKVTLDRGSQMEKSYGLYQSAELNKGIVGVHGAMSANGSKYAYSRFAIFSDKELTQQVDGYMYVSEYATSQGQDSIGYFRIPKAGTYYFVSYALYSADTDADDWRGATQMSVTLIINQYAQAKKGTKLKANRVYGVYSKPGATTTFKNKAAKTGTLHVTTDEYTKTKLKSKKGKLLGPQKDANYPPTFGVKKRTTYKLAVTTPKDSYDYGYYIYLTNSKVKSRAGTSQKKAGKLTQNKPKDGLIIAGKKKAQWFKFKVTKKADIQIYVLGNTNKKFKIEFYKGKTKLKNWTTNFDYKMSYRTVTSTSPVPKGTYYVKVSPTKQSSGACSVVWQYK